VLDHAKGIDVIEVDRPALAPVRRPGQPRRGRGRLEVLGFVDDGLEVARPGQRLSVRIAAGRQTGPVARNVRLWLELPPALRPGRLPRGARFDRRARRVVFRFPRLRRFGLRTVRARVKRTARVGARFELIAYARARGDQLPLTDRYVDVDRIGRRTRRTRRPRGAVAAAAAARGYGVCVLGAAGGAAAPLRGF